MRALEKKCDIRMVYDIKYIENLIKSLQWFIDIVFLSKKKNGVENEEFISVTFELNLLSQTDIFGKTRAFPESQDIAESHPFFREVTSELRKNGGVFFNEGRYFTFLLKRACANGNSIDRQI